MTAKFCQQCGHAMEPRDIDGRIVPVCPACGFTAWSNPVVATMVVIETPGGLILGRRSIEPGYGLWCLPGGFVNEDPFHPLRDPAARYGAGNQRHTIHGEETSYWGYGDRPLVVDTPSAGRKVFTGRTHLPTPTKVIWYNNANLINQAKWAYHLIKHVNPEGRPDRRPADRVDGVGRVRRRRGAGQQLARDADAGDGGVVLQPVPPDLGGRHRPAARHA